VVVGRELLREGDPVAVGQVDVEQQRVRACLGDGGARLREARGLADDPVAAIRQQGRSALTESRVVVDDDEAGANAFSVYASRGPGNGANPRACDRSRSSRGADRDLGAHARAAANRAVDSERAVERSDAVLEAGEPAPSRASRAADPVVAHLEA
jgi:hypothetical protein